MKNILIILLLIGSHLGMQAQVANQPDDLVLCDEGNDGIETFDLTLTATVIYGGQNPAEFTLTYHESLADANNGTPFIAAPESYVNIASPQTIYARLESISTGAFDLTSFDLILFPTPPDLGPFEIRLCDDEINGSSSTDKISTFDLTILETDITGGNPALVVEWFETLSDLQNGIPIVDPTQYQNTVTPQSIFILITDTNNGCETISSVTLTVLPNPTPFTPTPLEVCDDNNDGFTFFDLTSKDEEIIGGEPDVTVSYYETLGEAQQGDPGLALVSPYQNIDPFIQTIWARVTRISGVPCFTIVPLDLIVLDGCPSIAAPPEDIFINEGDDNGWARFDLTVNESLMLGAQDPNIFLFSYHLSLEDAQLDLNKIVNPQSYRNIANPQEIFVRFFNSTSNGYVLASFEIETDGVLDVPILFENKFAIYPNPFSETIFIQSTEGVLDLRVELIDINGRSLFTELNSVNAEKLELNFSQLPTGIYLLRLTSEKTLP